MCSLVRFRASALSIVMLILVAPVAEAQTQPTRSFVSDTRFGIGYTGAVPEAVLGAGVFMFFGQSRIGAFADWKMTMPSVTGDDIYCPAQLDTCTVDFVQTSRNDQEIQIFDEWLVFNGGLMYAVTPELAFMAGGGIVRQSRYREFFHDEDEGEERITLTGGYYVDDDGGSGWVPQFVGGVLFRAGPRLAFRFGYETAPGGMSIGGYFVR